MTDTYEDITTRGERVERCRRVERVKFSIKTPQVWFDGWRNRDRVMRYFGQCESCGRRCYGFDDGENDPRGVLGDHAVSLEHAEDYNATGRDIVACFLCTNDYDRYQYLLRRVARRAWKDANGDPYVY